MKYITIKKLKELGACDTELKIFRALFGQRARIHTENVSLAMRYKLSYMWLVINLLDGDKLRAFDQEHKILFTAHEERMERAVKRHFGNSPPSDAVSLYMTLNGWTELHKRKLAELIAHTLSELSD